MSIWSLMNYGAWAISALIYFWLLKDFLATNKNYSEDVLLGTYTEDELDISGEGGQG